MDSVLLEEEPVAPARREMSADKFEKMTDANRYELVDGILVERGMSAASGYVVFNLAAMLKPHLRAHKLGVLFSDDLGYRMLPDEPGTVRFPDASFIAAERLPPLPLPDGHFRMAPDFAFEAVSPTDRARDVNAKVIEYLSAGVRLVWVAYPELKELLAFRPDGSVQRFTESSTLAAEDLFPEWSAPASELFAVM